MLACLSGSEFYISECHKQPLLSNSNRFLSRQQYNLTRVAIFSDGVHKGRLLLKIAYLKKENRLLGEKIVLLFIFTLIFIIIF